MKTYFKAALLVALTIGIFGLLLPALISAASTELVLLGWVVLVITLPVFYFLGNSIFSDIDKHFNPPKEKQP